MTRGVRAIMNKRAGVKLSVGWGERTSERDKNELRKRERENL